MTKICAIEHCDNEIECPGSGTCKNCYNTILRWSKRKPKEILERSQTIGKYTARMQALVPTQVHIMNPKKVKLKALPGQIRIKPAPAKKRKTA